LRFSGITPARLASAVRVLRFQQGVGHRFRCFGDGGAIEQFCSEPMKGLILCMFRAMAWHANAELEFKTMQQKPDGFEERVRFYSPDFESVDPVEIRLVLRSYGPSELLLENAGGLRRKREALTCTSADEMIQRIELVDARAIRVSSMLTTRRAPMCAALTCTGQRVHSSTESTRIPLN
jgi:hypothetical protein